MMNREPRTSTWASEQRRGMKEYQRGGWPTDERVSRQLASGSCAPIPREGYSCLPMSICAKPEPIWSQKERMMLHAGRKDSMPTGHEVTLVSTSICVLLCTCLLLEQTQMFPGGFFHSHPIIAGFKRCCHTPLLSPQTAMVH